MQLSTILNEVLPTKTEQKKFPYRPRLTEIRKCYRIINDELFDSCLVMPKFEIKPRMKLILGLCSAVGYSKPNKSGCVITLRDKWYCKQWMMMALAHEMVHQYQWDILGIERKSIGKVPLMSHGPSFYLFRKRFNLYGIPLKRVHCRTHWFKHQNLLKC